MLNLDLVTEKSIDIQSTKEAVWNVLTDPEQIKQFLFGTETTTDWKVGSPISFRGEYQGQVYHDKGNVLENQPNELLKYNYWTSISGLPDTEENYSLVTYQIEEKGNEQVRFTWKQQGFSSQEGCEHTAQGLEAMLKQIKELVEN